ncbi:hypothetical protein CASFOL_034047 [Castilleja foliolosa]|uniref:RING-type domain-containing protein n=1 Tax=Castilleja foliolosa TaxID=1961234 RepID=A0ABD3BZV4_9LAMI
MELPPDRDDDDDMYIVEDDEDEGDEDEDEGGQLFGTNSNDINSSSQGVVNVDGLLSNNDETAPLNRGEVDGLFCPICFEGWSSGGDHHVCCLPCGHIYGLSCINKWLERPGSSKCPQCKKKCRIKDIRLLYATRVVALDGELQKKVQSLEAKCASLENQGVELSKKEAVWKIKEDSYIKMIESLKKNQLEARKKMIVFQGRTRMWMQAQIDEHMTLMREACDFRSDNY